MYAPIKAIKQYPDSTAYWRFPEGVFIPKGHEVVLIINGLVQTNNEARGYFMGDNGFTIFNGDKEINEFDTVEFAFAPVYVAPLSYRLKMKLVKLLERLTKKVKESAK